MRMFAAIDTHGQCLASKIDVQIRFQLTRNAKSWIFLGINRLLPIVIGKNNFEISTRLQRASTQLCLHYPEITEVINADHRTPTDTSGHTGSALVNEHYRIPGRNVRPRNANLTEKDRAVCRAYVFRIYTICTCLVAGPE